MEINKDWKFKKGVYMLHIDEHLYVGSSINIYNRLKSHNWALTAGKHDNTYLQRAYNKFGGHSLWCEVLEFCQDVSIADLRKKELFYIQKYNADLNLKKDPTTEYNCFTTSIEVYQYDYEGNFIKKWPSMSEAARFYKTGNSSIRCCCLNPKRQRECKGFLWSQEYPYPFELIPPIRVYDREGNFVNKYKDTTSITQDLFKDKAQKTVLSQLKKKINTNIPYFDYYLTTDVNFIVTEQMKTRYKKKTVLDKVLESNPLIYLYDRSNNFLGQEYLNNLPHAHSIAGRIKRGKCYGYSLVKYDPKVYYSPTRRHKCIAQDIFSGEVYIYNTRKAAALDLFGDIRFSSHIGKHLSRKTPFKGFRFRDL